MRFLFFVVFPVFLITLGVYGAGSSLPEKIVTIRGVTLPAAQKDVWKTINGFGSMADWRSKISSVTAIPKPSENKTLWHVKTTDKQSYLLERSYWLEPDILQLSMEEDTLSYRSQWDMSLTDKTVNAASKEEKDKPSTFLKIVDTAYTSNPFVRFYVNYFIGYDSRVESYLGDIAKLYNVADTEIKELVA